MVWRNGGFKMYLHHGLINNLGWMVMKNHVVSWLWMVSEFTMESKNGIQQWIDGNGLSYMHMIPLPPNAASRHQPTDQGIIVCTKKKYKYKIIWDLLWIYCNEEGKHRQFPVGVVRVIMESARVCVHMYMLISQGWIGFGMRRLKKALWFFF